MDECAHDRATRDYEATDNGNCPLCLIAERDALAAEVRTLKEQLNGKVDAELERIDNGYAKQCVELQAEVRELRERAAELERTAVHPTYQASLENQVANLATDLSAALAENAVMRSAMEDIARRLECSEPCQPAPEKTCDHCGKTTFERWCAGCTARAALSGDAGRAYRERMEKLEAFAVDAKRAMDSAEEWMTYNPPANGWGGLDHGQDHERKKVIAELDAARALLDGKEG